MRQKSGPEKQPAEDAIRDIRRATRQHLSAEEKIRIVLEGLRGEESTAELAPARARLTAQRRDLTVCQIHLRGRRFKQQRRSRPDVARCAPAARCAGRPRRGGEIRK